jgi:uncharacterized membrane protein
VSAITPGGRRRYRLSRLEAFSDGVFAIAITLLVLDIAVPSGSEENLGKALVEQWPSYLGYLVSFGTIGAVWFGHSVITEFVAAGDRTLFRLNLVLLLAVSFLPFPTRLLAEYVSDSEAVRVAATVYGVNLFLTSVALAALWRHVERSGLARDDSDEAERRILTTRLQPGLAGYAIFIAVGWFFPIVAVFGYLAVALAMLVPARRRNPESRIQSAGG